MKKLLMLFIIPAILLPVLSSAQYMKDYQPTGSPSVTSIVNLVSVVEGTASAAGSSRAVNTIQESATALTSDVWVHAVDVAGNVTFSQRYGIAGTNETATALIRCPNGDFIYTATTSTGGVLSAWLFRRGAINWSWRYFAAGNKVKPYCIKKTNELAENYIVAATINSDKNLLVFKINSNGVLVWNRQYNDAAPPNGLTDVPKSMLIKNDTVIIAGNRTTVSTSGVTSRDLFVIGVNQLTGAVAIPYRSIDNFGFNDIDPFINFSINSNEYVLIYQCIGNLGGLNTGRIGFTRINNLFVPVTGTTSLLSEPGALNSFGHTIYKSSTTGAAYDVGGGTTIGNLRNPLFISLTSTGLPVAGTYRRLWTNLDFNSTFMLQDIFVAANRYEHHNWKRSPNQNSMSLLRNPALAAPCNVFPQITQQFVDVPSLQRSYNPTPVITQTVYNIPNVAVHGKIPNCGSAIIGVFKGAQEPVESFGATDNIEGAIKIYPTLLRSGSMLNIELKTTKDEPTEVRVYNIQAQLLYIRKEQTIKGQNLFVVNTSGWIPGTYITEVKQGSETFKNKIVVE